MKQLKSSSLKWTLLVVMSIVVGSMIWVAQWATYARPPLPEAIEALESDALVTVTDAPWLAFSPAEKTPLVGLILYPGGRIDPRGYSPLARAIASAGYMVVIPEMPINMAVFKPDVADEIISYYSNIEVWAIGGHSVGGTMAVQYTDKHPAVINGLIIWASYPADSSDISDMDIPVVSIYGNREKTVTDNSVGERSYLLPEDTLYIRIEGGDHHQFGSYQIKPEEHLATISRASQQQQILEATLDLLAAVARSK